MIKVAATVVKKVVARVVARRVARLVATIVTPLEYCSRLQAGRPERRCDEGLF